MTVPGVNGARATICRLSLRGNSGAVSSRGRRITPRPGYECRPDKAFTPPSGMVSNDSVLLKITQEAAPAFFIERRDMGEHKVADALLAFYYLTDINRLVTR